MYQNIYCRKGVILIVFYIGLQNYKLFIVVLITFILFCLTMIDIYISSLSISWMYKVLVYWLMNNVYGHHHLIGYKSLLPSKESTLLTFTFKQLYI